MAYNRSSSGRSQSRRSSSFDDNYLDCKAAYLIIFDDLKDEIESKDQLSTVLQQSGRNPTEKMLRKYWTSSTRSITFDEFVNICEKEKPQSEEELIKAFKRIDINGDGFITHDELMKVMTTRGEKMTSREVREMIDEVDENKDGKLDYNEFAKMVMSTVSDVKNLARQKLEKRDRGSSKTSNGTASEDRRGSRPTSAKNTSRPSSARSSSSRGAGGDEGSATLHMSAVTRRARLAPPRDLGRWTSVRSKGCFHWDEEDGLLSHIYKLQLVSRTEVFITCQPTGSDADRENPIDTAVLVISGSPDQGAEGRIRNFTESRDSKGMYGLRMELDAGKYTLLPYTSGCRLKQSRGDDEQEAQLVRMKGGKVSLTRGFVDSLKYIFEVVDLDDNGTLSRSEFNWYNLRTSGEELVDEEWNVVEENIRLEKGEIPLEGFLRLNEMEAEDSAGGDKGANFDDLWVTLRSMGFNNSLNMTQACPFLLTVHTLERGVADLEVIALDPTPVTQVVVAQTCKDKGQPIVSSRDFDLTESPLKVYSYRNDFRVTFAVENRSRQPILARLKFDGSNVVSSSERDMTAEVHIPGRGLAVAASFLPKSERSEWSISLIGVEEHEPRRGHK